MIQIRPVSDLRNKFPEIERLVEAESTNTRYTHEEVMERVRKKIHGK